MRFMAFAVLCFVCLAACSVEDPGIGSKSSGLTDPMSLNYSRSDAILYFNDRLEELYDELPSSVKSCINGEDVELKDVTVACDITPEMEIFSPALYLGGTNIGAACKWKCTISVKGVPFDQRLRFFNKFLKPSDVAGGC